MNSTWHIDTPGVAVAPSSHPESSVNDAPGVGELNPTSPVGAIGPPAPASETIAVQVVEAVTATGDGEHAHARSRSRAGQPGSPCCEVCSSAGVEKSVTVTVVV